ncbi:hypothetical protein Poly59_26330 [Rubripirellula reticaptiva]|uniref:Uncharacterized protein n=1 Tax=Rubripirellula reticaptiva TaxID=2528013 RepID=A0A5C6F9E9_9BACT|nr:hypothetical protein Poly59_26330 [Rubripirellula reticaptiva]
MFPLWFLQFLVIGALMLVGIGVAALIAFLVFDSRDRQLW